MPRLTDDARRKQILEILELRRFSGEVRWKPVAAEELQREFEGVTPQGVNDLLFEFVQGGGDINEFDEHREGLPLGKVDEFRFLIGQEKVYVEARVEDDSEPYLWIVSFHRGWRE